MTKAEARAKELAKVHAMSLPGESYAARKARGVSFEKGYLTGREEALQELMVKLDHDKTRQKQTGK